MLECYLDTYRRATSTDAGVNRMATCPDIRALPAQTFMCYPDRCGSSTWIDAGVLTKRRRNDIWKGEGVLSG